MVVQLLKEARHLTILGLMEVGLVQHLSRALTSPPRTGEGNLPFPPSRRFQFLLVYSGPSPGSVP